ncbi:MAG: peroxiredoxin family protein [Acidimicrobiia bacterium]|nr:peroxiredoxin family protein [Acidimicrobiia bacterium]
MGDAAPDFSLSAAEGGSVALDGYHDQAVLLYFHMADG